MNIDLSVAPFPLFTPLHRWLGKEAEPMSMELLDEAVQANLQEQADLDFKSTPPPAAALKQSDLAKDVAAMANSGGGMLIYGVRDSESRAAEVCGIDHDFTRDTYLRDIRRIASNRVSPPVLGLTTKAFDDGTRHALAVLVPETEDAPHFIFTDESFKAPYRNGPDTAWMNERMIEAFYRARFTAKQAATRSLHELVTHATEGLPVTERAWMVAVSRPIHSIARGRRLDRPTAADIFNKACTSSDQWVRRNVHPLEWIDRVNPQTGFRRWIARSPSSGNHPKWRQVQAAICDDGTVTLAAAMGGAPVNQSDVFAPYEISSDRIETFLADFFALMCSTANSMGKHAYDLHVNLKWEGDHPIVLRARDPRMGHYRDADHSNQIHAFYPVESVIDTRVSEDVYLDSLREVALDVVNQGGVRVVRVLDSINQ